MAEDKTSNDSEHSPESIENDVQKIIPASAVGVSLAISASALKEIDRIQRENIKAAQESHKFAWR